MKQERKGKRNSRPSSEQIKRWKLKDWEKNWDKELLSDILQAIEDNCELDGTIVAPSLEVLGYILGEMRQAYLLHALIKLENQGKIFYRYKDDNYYVDYIPF